MACRVSYVRSGRIREEITMECGTCLVMLSVGMSSTEIDRKALLMNLRPSEAVSVRGMCTWYMFVVFVFVFTFSKTAVCDRCVLTKTSNAGRLAGVTWSTCERLRVSRKPVPNLALRCACVPVHCNHIHT